MGGYLYTFAKLGQVFFFKIVSIYPAIYIAMVYGFDTVLSYSRGVPR